MAVRPMKVWNAATSTWDDVAVSQRGDVVNKTDFAAKGDIIAGTGASAYDNVAAGSNGQMLMADSSATAGLRYVDPPANRNLIYNGAMQVHQRGTSATAITTAGYRTADRWQLAGANSFLGGWTESVETDGPSGSGFAKSLKVLCTTAAASPAANSAIFLNQRLEGQDLQRIAKGTASAQQLSVSFWVKSNVTGTYVVILDDVDNIRGVSGSYTVNASATWERKTITFPADTTGAFNNDNTQSMIVRFVLGAGSDRTSGGSLQTTWGTGTNTVAVGQTNLAAATNNYWQITGVQLETGPVATPFEFEPYEATLRKCQRYYYLHAEGTQRTVANASNALATAMYGAVQFPTTMRADASLVVATGTNFYSFYRNSADDQFNSLTIDRATTTGALIYNNSEISGTAGHAGFVYTNNASASIAFSAEL